MALIHSKQLNPKLTGSFTVSGSIVGDSKSTGSFSRGEIVGDSTVGGDLFVSQYIKHTSDADTFINFTDNRIRFKAGDIGFFDMEKDADAPYPATINPGGNRVNFRVVDRNTELLLKTDSEAFNVGLYHAGNKKLETAVGGIDITGHVTASGNISGSSASTASFGLVKVHAIGGNSPITFTDTIIENQNLQVLGSITGSGNVDFNGNLDVDGITNLDNTDIDGTLTVDGTNTTITSPIINLVGPISASSNISASGNLVLGGQITSTGDIRTSGDIIAENLIISSSVTYMTQSFSSGSTIFGDSNDDTHQFTGSLLNKGSITSTGNITVTGNIIAQGSINANQGQVFGSGINDRHEFTGSVVVTGSLNVEKGRVFEQGTSVIDHATAMAIVFGG